MTVEIGINDIEPQNYVAWVFAFHGCFSRGKTRDEAIALVPKRVSAYFKWLNDKEGTAEPAQPVTQVNVVEDITSVALPDGYFANAFFKHDQIPLTQLDVARGKEILQFQREDLIRLYHTLSPTELDTEVPGEIRHTIRGVLDHIATAEWWYLDRIDKAVPFSELETAMLDRLHQVRNLLNETLNNLIGDARISEKRSEMWSVKKVLRRALWHEKVHTEQIMRYAAIVRQDHD